MIEVLDPADPTGRTLALNNAHETELSWLDAGRLAELTRRAFYARRIGEVDAFLLAFQQDADYDSTNFLWFPNAFRASSISTGSSSRRKRVDAATPPALR